MEYLNLERWIGDDALGGSIRDCLLIVLFASIPSAIVICLNGRATSRYHVGYPVLPPVTLESGIVFCSHSTGNPWNYSGRRAAVPRGAVHLNPLEMHLSWIAEDSELYT